MCIITRVYFNYLTVSQAKVFSLNLNIIIPGEVPKDWRVANVMALFRKSCNRELQNGEPNIGDGKVTGGDTGRQDPPAFGKVRTDLGWLVWICAWEIVSHKFD